MITPNVEILDRDPKNICIPDSGPEIYTGCLPRTPSTTTFYRRFIEKLDKSLWFIVAGALLCGVTLSE